MPPKKRSLPLAAGRPTIEIARRSLGGPGSTTDAAGDVVEMLDGGDGVSAIGVVLYAAATGGEIDVWIDEGIVRRTRAENARLFRGHIPDALAALAVDVRLFAALRDGQRVHVPTARSVRDEGIIFEKCRYGALVVFADGRLLAVGFRKLRAVAGDHEARPN